MGWPLSMTGPMGLLTVGLAPELCFLWVQLTRCVEAWLISAEKPYGVSDGR